MRLIGCIAVMAMMFVPIGMSAPVSGAIFTTNSTCTGVNLNIYDSKDDVYLDGGPAHPGAAGLPDGSYYVQVTEPAGAVPGYDDTSNTSGEYKVWVSNVNTFDTASSKTDNFKVKIDIVDPPTLHVR